MSSQQQSRGKKQLSQASKPSTQKDHIPSTQVAQMPCLFPQNRLSNENMLSQKHQGRSAWQTFLQNKKCPEKYLKPHFLKRNWLFAWNTSTCKHIRLLIKLDKPEPVQTKYKCETHTQALKQMYSFISFTDYLLILTLKHLVRMPKKVFRTPYLKQIIKSKKLFLNILSFLFWMPNNSFKYTFFFLRNPNVFSYSAQIALHTNNYLQIFKLLLLTFVWQKLSKLFF